MAESGSADWIDQWLEFTRGIPSPEIFRLWAGIGCIAGALERRVWLELSGGPLYPNLFTLLVGRPGVGKSQIISQVHKIWMEIKDFKVAPSNMTKAALVDALHNARRQILRNPTEMIEYHSLLIASSEFGVLVPAHDLEFLNTLNDVYDNPTSYREARRMFGNKQIDIVNPQLNILAGTQPTYMASLLPEEAWGMGFTSRLLLIYSAEKIKKNIFEVDPFREKGFKELVKGVERVSKVHGKMTFDPEAIKAALAWDDAGQPPVPEHSKLENYNARRFTHVLKLSMISAISGGRSQIYLRDFTRGREWLTHAETYMPDVFRDMILRSDHQVLQELHMFIWQLYAREKRAVHQARLINFLSGRVPSEKVMRLLELAEKANIITRLAGTETYKPRPKHEHGME